MGIRTLATRAAIWLMKRTNFVVRRRLLGVDFRVPVLGTRGLGVGGDREPEVAQVLCSTLAERRGAFLDVGVNLGQTLLYFEATSPGRRYIGFEPNPLACAYTLTLISQNKMDHATVLPVALASRADVRRLNLTSDPTSDMASLQKRHKPDGYFGEEIEVLCERGDSLLERLGEVDVALLKIDAEGSELEVLLGFEQTISRARPPIVLEVLGEVKGHSVQVNEHRAEVARSLEEWVTNHEYEILALHAGQPPYKVGSFAEPVGQGRGSNYLLRPAECNIAEDHDSAST